jgi:microcystin-dependent protein
MSNTCTNCYNGCAEITSDKCVKYTGVDIPDLGISNGDTLLHVEQQIISYLQTTLDGTGIFPEIPSNVICDLVQSNLPVSGPLTLNDYLTGVIETLCDLENRILSLENQNPNTLYDVDCLSPSSNTDTHEVLQSVIYKVCSLSTQLADFVTYVDATYVKISDINTYIQNYLDSQPTEQLVSNRMVPYSIVAAAGGFNFLSNFDISGAGIGDWDRIFLCNGQNGTPDLRGRALIGVTTGMGGGQLDTAVDPTEPGNPNYEIGSTHGSNSIALNGNQIPPHTHTANATSTVTPESHSHLTVGPNTAGTGLNNLDPIEPSNTGGGNTGYALRSSTGNPVAGKTSDQSLSVNTNVTIGNTGGGLGHPNYQPGRGVYYITYLP